LKKKKKKKKKKKNFKKKKKKKKKNKNLNSVCKLENLLPKFPLSLLPSFPPVVFSFLKMVLLVLKLNF